jgi:hypothetical protein
MKHEQPEPVVDAYFYYRCACGRQVTPLKNTSAYLRLTRCCSKCGGYWYDWRDLGELRSASSEAARSLQVPCGQPSPSTIQNASNAVLSLIREECRLIIESLEALELQNRDPAPRGRLNVMGAQLRWTKELPKVDGWYWWRFAAGGRRPIFRHVLNGQTTPVFEVWGILLGGGEWAGPIPEPEGD